MSKLPSFPINPAVTRQIAEAKKAEAKLEVLPSTMKLPANVPTLIDGSDKATAKQLTKLFKDAQTGMRRIVALGLFAWEIKETKLKHGEWGPWLAVNAPELCRPDSVTGKPKATHALSNFMELTRGVLESVGFDTLEKYFATVAKFPHGGNLNCGRLLLLPDKKIPVEAKPLREKIFELVDNKTQRQLFLEFKQAEEDATGTAKPKRGRLKGQGGASKEQRERAAQLAEEEQVTALNLWCEEIAVAIMQRADDQGLGRVGVKDSPEYNQLLEAAKYLLGWSKHE